MNSFFKYWAYYLLKPTILVRDITLGGYGCRYRFNTEGKSKRKNTRTDFEKNKMLIQRPQISDIKIVIFATSRKERDLLRNQLSTQNAIFLFFEKEAICFDNLGSIRPDIVILRTDSEDIVWRFIFAARTFKLVIRLLIISDVLVPQNFKIEDKGFCISQIEIHRMSDELWDSIRQLLTSAKQNAEYEDIPFLIGKSAAVKNIRSAIPKIKRAYDPILISGESGTGKKLIAQLLGNPIHSNDRFCKFDCENLSRDDNQDALHFYMAQNINGHAVNVLMRGIDKANMRLQSELLMLIDDGNGSQNQPGNKPKFRLIATSNSNLNSLTKQGKFRRDLFFRLNVIPLEIPPLRERKEDIPLLADFFILQSRKQLNKSFMTLSPEIRQMLYLYDWPGNVDELRQIIHKIAVDGDEEASVSNVFCSNDDQSHRNYFRQLNGVAVLPDVNEIKSEFNNLNHLPLKAICERFVTQTEKKIMQKALETTNWNRKKAASLLNISYKSMLNKMKMYEIV